MPLKISKMISMKRRKEKLRKVDIILWIKMEKMDYMEEKVNLPKIPKIRV